jgi:cytochrome c oxidase assembly protein subunit 15
MSADAPMLATWTRRLALSGVLLCLVVVVLGAYVRLNAAGLSCPDWPGCYGAASPALITPDASAQAASEHLPIDVGKAWREMIHRYAAGTLGLIIAALALLAVLTRGRLVSLPFAFTLFAVLIVQAVLGMLTVTLRLTPLIVTAHLFFGMTTLALLAWLAFALKARAPSHDAARLPRRLALAALVVLAMQIALGGWTSSNYAALACPDFPTCQGRWWPASDFAHAFVLWRGVDLHYEGGVLGGPARAAIQLTHRLGACAATLMLLLAAGITLVRAAPRRARRAAWAVVCALILQLAIAIAMVKQGFPLALATAHNAGAALLLLATVALYNALSTRPAQAATTIANERARVDPY